jgi:hypothetical protein
LVHEAATHEVNCFVTLTFAPEHLPPDGSVRVEDVQGFMKRLRKRVGRVRFFACGEYGEDLGRPHYHLLLFGWAPSDRQLWRRTGSGHLVYRSQLLEAVWPFGHVEIGDVTPHSAGYVARYATKKVTGDAAEEHYSRVDGETGEVTQRRPEFITMSRRPGIGAAWWDEFSGDAFPSDFVVLDGKRRPVPRFYKKKLDDLEAAKVTQRRKENARRHEDEQRPERLAVREEVTLRKLNEVMKRDLEEGEDQ